MNAAELFALHVASGISQYRGTVLFLEKILRAGEMPDAAEPVVQAHIEKLRQFLATQGNPEHDEFLLRFGLVAPGALRGIHPPISVLAPERGGFSDKRLQQAAEQVGRLREALALGLEFFPNLNRDTAIALQELKAQAGEASALDAQWADAHASLPPTEADNLVTRAFRCLESPRENVREVGLSALQALADCRPEGLGAATAWLLERGIRSPSSLYRGASKNVAESLVQEIGAADGVQLNHLLLALAWTRGETAQQAFLEWKTLPPAWAARLQVPVEGYLHGAGWALDDDGKRRELISLSCHRIAKKPPLSEPSLAVPCRVPMASNCPACGSVLSWLFDFSALPPRFFAGDREGAPRKLLCCLNCACPSPVFSHYSPAGDAQWHPGTVSSESDPFEPRSECLCQLSSAPFPPFATAHPFRLDDASTLGGLPMWLQDPEYPRCPDCAKPMRFLAQFDNLAMPQAEEGIYYAFFCRACQVAAVSYQQT